MVLNLVDVTISSRKSMTKTRIKTKTRNLSCVHVVLVPRFKSLCIVLKLQRPETCAVQQKERKSRKWRASQWENCSVGSVCSSGIMAFSIAKSGPFQPRNTGAKLEPGVSWDSFVLLKGAKGLTFVPPQW